MSADIAWLRCSHPDDILVAKRHLRDALNHVLSPCGHPHLIVLTDDLSDIRFVAREALKADGATT